MKLLRQQLFQFCKNLAQIFRLGAAGLGHVGAAAAFAADQRGELLDDVSGMEFIG
ncbi:MAG: hypothetical protein H6Q04_3087, partial [Acidobacteria bacterium]|nr:hypothetical protein [Acidobacteriota bacterium]